MKQLPDMKKKKIYIYGVGTGYQCAKQCFKQENVLFLSAIDKNADKFADGIDSMPVIKVEQLNLEIEFDFIVITVKNYIDILDTLIMRGVGRDKIIVFFSIEDTCNVEFGDFIDRNVWRAEVFSYLYMSEIKPQLANLKYEVADEIRKGQLQIPKVLSVDETIEIVCKKKASICRFGDGEFDLIYMHKRAKFQNVDADLAERLRNILLDKNSKALVAIADNYGSLGQYTQRAQKDIREYLTPSIREKHYELLDMEREYFNAYFTRVYAMYRDKKLAADRIKRIKNLWENEKILIVEGDKTRMGIGNDLFAGAKTIERIIAPCEDAFQCYDKILNKVQEYGKEKLILLALGPTATVLAYDLAKLGYWAVDIGHFDLEYEWYKRNTSDKCIIEYKYVNEIANGEKVYDNGEFLQYKEAYEQQIIAKII